MLDHGDRASIEEGLEFADFQCLVNPTWLLIFGESWDLR